MYLWWSTPLNWESQFPWLYTQILYYVAADHRGNKKSLIWEWFINEIIAHTDYLQEFILLKWNWDMHNLFPCCLWNTKFFLKFHKLDRTLGNLMGTTNTTMIRCKAWYQSHCTFIRGAAEIIRRRQRATVIISCGLCPPRY